MKISELREGKRFRLLIGSPKVYQYLGCKTYRNKFTMYMYRIYKIGKYPMTAGFLTTNPNIEVHPYD